MSTSTRATAIEVAPRGIGRSQVNGVKVAGPQGESTLSADLVVAAADIPQIEQTLLPPKLRTYSERYWHRRTPGPGALVLLLGVRGELPQLAHHTLLFATQWSEGFEAIFGSEKHVPNPASLYICKTSATEQTGNGVAPEGHENIFVLVPAPADTSSGPGGVDRSGSAEVEELADRVIDQIAHWAGIEDLAQRVVLRRTMSPWDFKHDFGAWQGTALGPAHTLKQSAFFRTKNRSKKVKGLYFAGSSTIPGIGVPMCLISAELILKHLRSDRSSTPIPEPHPRAPKNTE